MKKLFCMLCAGAAFSSIGLSLAQAWSLEEAAKDYKGTEIKVIFLDRPGYRAAIKMLPEFEQKTGIKVSYEIIPYDSSREKEVLDFSAQGDLAIALVDLVWIGEYAESGGKIPVHSPDGRILAGWCPRVSSPLRGMASAFRHRRRVGHQNDGWPGDGKAGLRTDRQASGGHT
jgi:hypothetical protein